MCYRLCAKTLSIWTFKHRDFEAKEVKKMFFESKLFFQKKIFFQKNFFSLKQFQKIVFKMQIF